MDRKRVERMDLNLLQIFDQVMIERHVTRAAESLGLTQSAVSNAIVKLRDELQDTLFVKVPKGVEPTPKASALWPDVHTALAQLKKSMRINVFDPHTSKTEFRVSMTDLSASLLTPFLYKSMQKNGPSTKLFLVQDDSELTDGRLSRSEIDFAISVQDPKMSTLECRTLWKENYVVAGRKDHPFLQKKISLKKFCEAEHLVINPSGTGSYRLPIDLALKEMNMARNIKLNVNQFLVATRMLRTSDLLAVLPSRLVNDAFRQNWLTWQPLPIESPEFSVKLIYHRRNSASASTLWFVDQVFDAIEKMNDDLMSD
ncbi:LysR family transcriptional regulator [Alteromonas sp. RKMC-009]|uniref:LysR family transcriptional regulator n=1 Tax=Alteromonas sp. RKMC-009 TaxID=2267264 RepID=UPI0013761730|nr:LysR family transcriptional regulator [Alteromonas sp. RKMC-009]